MPQPGRTLDVFDGTERLLLETIRLRRKIVQRATAVEWIAGVRLRFSPASQVPSCGGGGSLSVEFGLSPIALSRNTESWTTRCPPDIELAKPSAFRSARACDTVARQSRQAPTYRPESLKPEA